MKSTCSQPQLNQSWHIVFESILNGIHLFISTRFVCKIMICASKLKQNQFQVQERYNIVWDVSFLWLFCVVCFVAAYHIRSWPPLERNIRNWMDKGWNDERTWSGGSRSSAKRNHVLWASFYRTGTCQVSDDAHLHKSWDQKSKERLYYLMCIKFVT